MKVFGENRYEDEDEDEEEETQKHTPEDHGQGVLDFESFDDFVCRF